MIYIEGGGGGTRVSSTRLTTPNAASPITTPGAPARRVIAIWGDSNAVGFSASTEAATGFRQRLQRVLAEAGIWFRLVGFKGYGAPNGTGTTWGRFPAVDDFHDAPIYILQDWRSDGHYGRKLFDSFTISSINTGTSTITATGHLLGNGSPFVISAGQGGTLPTITGLSPITGADGVQYLLGWATNITASTFQVSLYDGGTAAAITAAGSGTLTLGTGLTQLIPAVFASSYYDEQPTDIVLVGGTNDISTLVDAGASNIDATMQTRGDAYFDAIDLVAPNARKYAISVLPIVAPAGNQAAKQAQVVLYNAWQAANVAQRGSKWAYVNATANIGAAEMASGDGYHPYSYGYNDVGTNIGRSIIAASGSGSADDAVPHAFARRPTQACVELRATSDNVRIPQQAILNPTSNSFFAAIWFMPFNLGSGTNAILQCENPYSGGCLISCTNSNLLMAWKSGSFCIPSSSYTAVLKRYRWHRLFAFFDRTKSQAALFCNGMLVQRVHTTASDITASLGWYIGGGGLSSAPGLYQGFLCGVGSTLSIEDAARMAQRDYFLGLDPPGTTAKYLLDDGSGTAPAGKVQGSTAGVYTVTTGGWVAATLSRYWKHVDLGYVKPKWDQRIATYTATATWVANELAKYDCTSGGFTATIPSAASANGQEMLLIESGGSTNILTIAPSSGTIAGGASTTKAVANAVTRLIPDGTNWLVV